MNENLQSVLSSSTHPAQWVRFGLFRADLKSGELWKNGNRIKLQEQPFRMLQALLESPGELVSREELRRKLWPEETYVNFDAALNTCATRLRDALDDTAATPQFVETVARRGYRFIAPLSWDGGAEHPPAESGETVTAAGPFLVKDRRTLPKMPGWAVALIASAAAAVALSLLAIFLMFHHVLTAH